jgi:hypothetical protein
MAGAKYLGGGTYSFSGAYATMAGGKITTSVTTGIAQHAKDLWILHFFVIGAAGMAQTQNTTVSLGLALNSGVLTIIPLGRTSYSIDVLTQAIKVPSGTNLTVSLGLGWGK